MVVIDRERLAGAVRIRRKAARMADVASEIGVSPATFYRLERGQHEPSAGTFLAACRWLRRNPWDFVKTPGECQCHSHYERTGQHADGCPLAAPVNEGDP